RHSSIRSGTAGDHPSHPHTGAHHANLDREVGSTMTAVKRANGVMAGAVLAYLQREADLDGLATVSSGEIGTALGVTAGSAQRHLSALAEAGLITQAGHTRGVKGYAIMAYQLSDEVSP